MSHCTTGIPKKLQKIYPAGTKCTDADDINTKMVNVWR